MKKLIKRLFYSKDYKPVIVAEFTQGDSSFVHYIYDCEVVR